jgi:hypothetical protein
VAATPNLISHVAVHKLTVHDGHRLPDALDDLAERSFTPTVMLFAVLPKSSSVKKRP